jgi:hypothetical protein
MRRHTYADDSKAHHSQPHQVADGCITQCDHYAQDQGDDRPRPWPPGREPGKGGTRPLILKQATSLNWPAPAGLFITDCYRDRDVH